VFISTQFNSTELN